MKKENIYTVLDLWHIAMIQHTLFLCWVWIENNIFVMFYKYIVTKKYFLNYHFEENVICELWLDDIVAFHCLLIGTTKPKSDGHYRSAYQLGSPWVRSRDRLHPYPRAPNKDAGTRPFSFLSCSANQTKPSRQCGGATPQRRRHGARGIPCALPPFLPRRTPVLN